MKKTTKKTTKKETFTQEAAEKLYENILEMEDTMQKLGADMDKVRSGRLFYMTNHFDITEAEAKEFLDKMEKKETKEENTLTKDTDKIEICSCANCYYNDANDKLSTINGKMTVGALKGLKWKQDEDGTITAKDGIMTLHFYRTDNKIPALHVNENGNGTICDVFLTDRNGKEHCMEVRGYIYDDHRSDNDQADEWDYGYDFWGRRKFLRFVKEVTGYKL